MCKLSKKSDKDKERKTSDTRETVNDKKRRRQRAQSRDIRLTFMIKGSGQPENLAASRKGKYLQGQNVSHKLFTSTKECTQGCGDQARKRLGKTNNRWRVN